MRTHTPFDLPNSKQCRGANDFDLNNFLVASSWGPSSPKSGSPPIICRGINKEINGSIY